MPAEGENEFLRKSAMAAPACVDVDPNFKLSGKTK